MGHSSVSLLFHFVFLDLNAVAGNMDRTTLCCLLLPWAIKKAAGCIMDYEWESMSWQNVAATEVMSMLFLDIDLVFFWNIAKKTYWRYLRSSIEKVFLSVIAPNHLCMHVLNAKYFIAWKRHHLNFSNVQFFILHRVYINGLFSHAVGVI